MGVVKIIRRDTGEIKVLSPDGGASDATGPADGEQPIAKLGIVAVGETEPEPALEAPDDCWPKPLAPVAFHGLAGEIVQAILPHTEADEAALLVQLLAVVGNDIGRGPHYRVEGGRHGCNLFVAIVGASGKGRKGSSLGHILAMARVADPAWTLNCVTNGLKSGPGLIYEVRDPVEKLERVRRDEEDKPERQKVIVDPGVEDKRLLIIEPELSVVFEVVGKGNTVSPLLRQAWDGVSLKTMVRENPIRATDPHISIIGHITDDELRRTLHPSQLTNGFANRFLFVCARRSKVLPEGGSLSDDTVEELGLRLGKAIECARKIGRVERDDDARALWAEMYEDLSEARPGVVGAATNRAEAQVLRLSVIYALLDGSSKVSCHHLRAAWEVWRYCEDSVRYALGGSLRDPVVEKLLIALRAVRPKVLTRTEIRDLFSRHLSSSQIRRALDHLEATGAVTRFEVKTAGRPAIGWKAV